MAPPDVNAVLLSTSVCDTATAVAEFVTGVTTRGVGVPTTARATGSDCVGIPAVGRISRSVGGGVFVAGGLAPQPPGNTASSAATTPPPPASDLHATWQ